MRCFRFVFMLALLPLAACMGRGLPPQSSAEMALRELPLYGGDIVVRGPDGYCVDPASHRQNSGSTLVFIGSCEALTGKAGTRVEAALMTVTVTPRRPRTSQPTASGIAAALSPKAVLEQIDEDGIAMVHFNAGGDAALPGGDPRYWRAGMALGGHLLSLAVYGPDGSRIAGPGGQSLLRALASEIRSASPHGARSATAEHNAPTQAKAANTQMNTRKNTANGFAGVFGALFPNRN